MKKESNYCLASVCMLFLSLQAFAGDIGNGWSEKSSITQIRHDSGKVDFLITSSLAGCGTPSDAASWWRAPVIDVIDNKERRALLFLAYASGKKVKLRCENSLVSDIAVLD